MRRSRPSLVILAVSLVCGILALLPGLGIDLVALPVSRFVLMSMAWALLLAGVLHPRL